MKIKLLLSTILTTALVTALAAPALAVTGSPTNAPSKYFASGAKVAALYQGFYGVSGVQKVLVHRDPAITDFWAQTGASEATLTVKCEVLKRNGVDTKIQSYNNKIQPGTGTKTMIWGDGRPCLKVVSVFLRAFPGDLDNDGSLNESWATKDFDDVALAVDALNNTPRWPNNRPMRITISWYLPN